MNRKLLLIGLGFAIVFMALLLRDFVRDSLIIPLLKLIRFVDDLPQDLLWFFFLGIILFFAYKSLIKWEIPGFKVRRSKVNHRGQIEVLADLIGKADEGDYFRERLVQYLCELTLEILAYRERLTPAIIKERLRSGTLNVPPEIMAYLQAGLIWDSHHYRKMGRIRLRSNTQGSPLDLEPMRVVEFLEYQLSYQLEVPSGIKDQ